MALTNVPNTNVVYLRVSGDDATALINSQTFPYRTLASAIAAMPVGARLDLGPGTFYGKTIQLKPGFIQGAGKHATRLVDTNYLSASFLTLTNNVTIRDLGIYFSTGITNIATRGVPLLIPKNGATNVFLSGLLGYGDGDVLAAKNGLTNLLTCNLVNCSFFSFYNAVNVKATTAGTNSTLLIIGSDFHTAGDSLGYRYQIQGIGAGFGNNVLKSHCVILSGLFGATNAVTLTGNWFEAHDSALLAYGLDLGGADDAASGLPVFAQISGNVFNSGDNAGTNIAWLVSGGVITPAPDYQDIYLSNGSQLSTSGQATNTFRIKNVGGTNLINGFPARAGNGVALTGAPQPEDTLMDPAKPRKFTLTTFLVPFQHHTNLQAMWEYTGTTPTNLALVSALPIFTDTNVAAVRDPSHFKWVDNNNKVHYLLSYGAYSNNSINVVGVATSVDDRNYATLGYIDFGGHSNQWSAKFCVNATNGLMMTVALGDTPQPTNAFVCDINPTNFLKFSNLRYLNIKPASHQGDEQSAGQLLYRGGIQYYFSSSGDEFTNANGPVQDGWRLAGNDGVSSIGRAGPSVFKYNGTWYWFTTDVGLQYIYSTDLVHWLGAAGQPVFFAPHDSPIMISNAWNEGAFIVE